MKKISTITASLDFSPKPLPDDHETAEIVNKLFRVFQGIFPAFRQAWPTEQEFNFAKKEWVKAFLQADMTDIAIIKLGVDKFRLMDSPFVPSPGQFIKMCKKETIPACHRDYIPLPQPEASREIALAALAHLKATLK